MKPIAHEITLKSAGKFFIYTVVFDTIIALFLTAMKFGGGFPIKVQ